MSKKLRADLLLLLITIIWGSSFPLMKLVLNYLPAYGYITLRFFIAAFVLTAIFHKNLRKLNKRTIICGCIIGLFMFAGTALQVIGLYTTSASNSGFITGLNVVMVPVFSAIMLRKKPDRASFIGVVIAFAGLFFLSGGLNFNFNIGDFLTFLCSICWALQIIFIDKFNQNEDASLLAIIQMYFIGIAGALFWIAFDAGKPVIINGTSAIILLITGVLGSALAFGGQTIAQKDTTPTHTALIFTAEPVFAGLFAMIIPDAAGNTETLTITKTIGCVLILAGMLVSELKPGKKENKKQVELNDGQV